MYLILDLEATCWESKPDKDDSEIIEIGAVILGDDYETLKEFQSFVKPIRNGKLSPFCTAQTTITQEQVDAAPRFQDVLAALKKEVKELGVDLSDLDFYSWGHYDKNQLMKDCAFHGIKYPFGKHRSLKHDLVEVYGKKMGLGKALKKLGMKFDGTQHRAIDDTRNIARIFVKEQGKLRNHEKTK